MIEKSCVVCGKKFQVVPAREHTAKACSSKCGYIVRAKTRSRPVPKTCKTCGKEFIARPSEVGTYCSYECMINRMRGSTHQKWKGGEVVAKGYIRKWAPDHPFALNGMYVNKHRLVMEKRLREENPESEFLVKLGSQRYLSPDARVHHLDGNPKNNRKRNLVVIWPSAHSLLHHGTMPEPGTYWPPDAKIKLGAPAKGRKTPMLPAKGDQAT